MTPTEIIVKLAGPDDPGRPRLLAYATVVFDDSLAVHDLKIIDGRDGLFVAMPSKPAPVRCPCGRKNFVLERTGEPMYVKRPSGYIQVGKDCIGCGEPLPQLERGRRFLDIAHPIRHSFRDDLERAVLDEYKGLVERERLVQGPEVAGPVN